MDDSSLTSFEIFLQDGQPNFRDLDSDDDGTPDLSEGPNSDANNDGVKDFLDSTVACSIATPGQVWRTVDQAKAVQTVTCEDTVANGDIRCKVGNPSCTALVNRFHGSVGDMYTIRCPADCGLSGAIVYGPGNSEDPVSCDGTKFMDHSSICRAAIAQGALVQGLAGLVVIRLVEPMESYPSCLGMPKILNGLPTPKPLVNGTGFSWDEWNKADNCSNQVAFGAPSDCCNYSTSLANVTITPDGGGCCAIQRYRQKWLGHFWIGVRAFEIMPHTYQAGCPVYATSEDCNNQTDCYFDDNCGCIDIGGSCGHPCGAIPSMAHVSSSSLSSSGDRRRSGGMTCGNYNSNDCKTEFRNAQNNRKLDDFYRRCKNEGGSNPLRKRCKYCCEEDSGTDGMTCGNYNSNDCQSEFRNAQRNKKLSDFYRRCRNEGGSNPLRKRCKYCCGEKKDQKPSTASTPSTPASRCGPKFGNSNCGGVGDTPNPSWAKYCNESRIALQYSRLLQKAQVRNS